jgi:hypothetical protein
LTPSLRPRTFTGLMRPPGELAEGPSAGRPLELFLVLLVGLVGVGVFHRATLWSGLDVVQADIGDSRLLIFLFDHWRRVLAGTSRWSSPSMFYPLTGALGYSDMLLGMGLPYAALRRMGLGLFEAANATLVLLSVVSYLSAYWLLRRVIRLGTLAGLVGALLFAVAYPKFSEQAHLQLRFDFVQPLALGALLPLWLEDRPFRPAELALRFNAFVALVGLGAMTTFYNAWFFLFWVAATVCVAALLPGLRARTAARLKEARLILWQPVLLGALLMVPFFSLYVTAMRTGTGRTFESTVVPTLTDYLRVGPNHPVWSFLPLNAPGPGTEQRAGMGLMVTLVLLTGWGWSTWQVARSVRRREGPAGPRRELLAAGLVGALLVTLTTVKVGSFAPWRAVYLLVPGASALIAVGRWTLTLMLPACILVAVLLELGWQACRHHRLARLGLAALSLLLLAEQVGRIGVQYSGSVALRYHQAIADSIPASCEAFLLAPTKGAMVSRGQFDGARYLAANPDVAKGWHGTAWEHYSTFGFREGREGFLLAPTDGSAQAGFMRREDFDDAKYLAANPDVAANWHASPWDHYRQFGFLEGRSLDPDEAAVRRWQNFDYQVTALVASAIVGKPTVNGASGLLPVGYPLSNVFDPRIEPLLDAWLRGFPDRHACLIRRTLWPDDLLRPR